MEPIIVAELFSSQVALIGGAALMGLTVTALAIVRDVATRGV